LTESQQNHIALPGSFRSVISTDKTLGPVDPNEEIEVSVYLRRPDIDEESLKPRLGKPRVQASMQASPQAIALVEKYAQQHGLSVVRVVPEAYQVVLTGAAQAMQQAFKVEKLERVDTTSGPRRVRSGHIYIPLEWKEVVVSVLGIDDRSQARTLFQRTAQIDRADALRRSQVYAPTDIANLYNFPPNTDGTGQCIALIELGGGYQDQDLQQYFANLPSQPVVVAVSVDGANNVPGGDPYGADGEVELDIEIAGSCATGVKIAVYFAPNTDRGFVDAINQAVHDQTNKPNIISISWGAPDVSWTSQAKTAMNQAFQAAAQQGVTICCATGDTGANDGVRDGSVHVDFPSASPYVLACGGTHLEANVQQNTINLESVWNDGPGSATGGGVSTEFAVPSWQKSINPVSIASRRPGRGTPDVSGNADPRTGYRVLIDGSPQSIGGTSAVAPLWSALLARLNQALNSSIGFINPLLYTNYTQIMHVAGFHDITQGNNNGYSARRGWDACTGLGTPNGVQLLSVLHSLATPVTLEADAAASIQVLNIEAAVPEQVLAENVPAPEQNLATDTGGNPAI
jgi:Predicted protease